MSKAIRETLTKRAKEYYIVLDDVAITDLSFGPEFSQAIERKQVAQQEAEVSSSLEFVSNTIESQMGSKEG